MSFISIPFEAISKITCKQDELYQHIHILLIISYILGRSSSETHDFFIFVRQGELILAFSIELLLLIFCLDFILKDLKASIMIML